MLAFICVAVEGWPSRLLLSCGPFASRLLITVYAEMGIGRNFRNFGRSRGDRNEGAEIRS